MFVTIELPLIVIKRGTHALRFFVRNPAHPLACLWVRARVVELRVDLSGPVRAAGPRGPATWPEARDARPHGERETGGRAHEQPCSVSVLVSWRAVTTTPECRIHATTGQNGILCFMLSIH